MKQVKKILAIVVALVLAISMIPVTNVDAAAKVKLNKKKASIYVGKTVQLKVKNNKKKVKWSSSNKKVATVSKKGKVKGKKAGKATITAKVGKKKYKCKVTVKKKVVNKPTVQPTTKPVEQATTQQPTTKPVEQTTTQPTIVIPTEVVGASVVKQDKAEVSFMWSQNATQSNAGQSYKVYIDGVFYNQYPMPTTITYKFTSVGSHTIRITGVLNGLETTGVTLNVSVTDLGDTNGNTTTQQPTTQTPTTEQPTTEDLGDSGEDWIVEGSSTKVYIKEYIGTDTNIVIPSKIQGKEVVGIREGAFQYSDIESVIIPGTVTEIEEFAFQGCQNLKRVQLLEGVKKIGMGAFEYCENLSDIDFSSSVVEFEMWAFIGTKWYDNQPNPIIINNTLIRAGTADVNGELIIPDGVLRISDWSIDVDVKILIIPKSVIQISKDIVINSGMNYCYYGVIKGVKGSYAETYANENSLTFIAQ